MLIVVRRVPILELIEAASSLFLYDLFERIAGLRSPRKCLLLELAISLAWLFLPIITIRRHLALGHHHGLRVCLNTHNGLVDFVKVVRLCYRLGLSHANAASLASLRSLLLAIIILARIVAIHKCSQWVDLFLLSVHLSFRCLDSGVAIVFWLANWLLLFGTLGVACGAGSLPLVILLLAACRCSIFSLASLVRLLLVCRLPSLHNLLYYLKSLIV